MKILVDIGHPAHVHFFKNFIKEMDKRGHSFLITARDKDVAKNLLDKYGFEYTIISERNGGLSDNKFFELVKRDYKIFKFAKKFKPDILMGIGGENVAHVSKLTKAKSVVFTDTEHAKTINSLTFPFADTICTPSCFKNDLGKKHIRYNGYHELAYLHPNYFTPNPAVLDEIGLGEDDTFIILRFVSWNASHDVGQHGIQDRTALVRELERYGQVFITSEGRLDGGLAKYQIKVAPEKMHDLMYYASLYVGDSPTMATESAILGVPAVLVSSWAYKAGNMEELRDKYGLMFPFSNQDSAVKKATYLLKNNLDKSYWFKKRENLLKDKIDVTAFMVEFIENYLESSKEMLK